MGQRTSAFTVMELVIALGVLAVVMTLTAQVGYECMRERTRAGARQAALELATNTLESARTLPFSQLTAEWAAGQKVPDAALLYLPGGKLEVQVEPDKTLPQARRLRVAVTWDGEVHTPRLRLELMTICAGRESGQGGTP